MYISLRLTPARLLMLVTAVLCAVLICDAAATLKAADSRITLASDFERAAYLESLGCPVESEPASVRQLTISSSPDETMNAYLSVLEKQGYFPRRFEGRKLTLYTYRELNSASGYARLLMCADELVGADRYVLSGADVSLPVRQVD